MVRWAIKLSTTSLRLLLIQLKCNSICIYNHIFVNQIIHLSLLCIYAAEVNRTDYSALMK